MYTPKDGFHYYLDLAKGKACQTLFTSSDTFKFLKAISEERSIFRYASNKWSIKQIVGHITDHERIKIHRAFLLSRKENIELWGYDQNALVEHSRFEALTMDQLLNDFEHVRKASISFIATLSKEQMKIKGKANKFNTTLEDFLRTIIGHEIHHVNIIKERYLKTSDWS